MLNLPFNPKLAGIVLLALALLAGVLYCRHLKSNLVEMTVQRDAAVQQVELQNRAIEQMHRESQAREQAGKVLVEQAKKEAEQSRQKAITIARTKPTDPNDMCKSALSLINESE